jgi:hypothetical protein
VISFKIRFSIKIIKKIIPAIRRKNIPITRTLTILGLRGKKLIKYIRAIVDKMTLIKELTKPVIRTLTKPFSIEMLHISLRISGVAKYPERAGVTSLNSCPTKLTSITLSSGAELSRDFIGM